MIKKAVILYSVAMFLGLLVSGCASSGDYPVVKNESQLPTLEERYYRKFREIELGMSLGDYLSLFPFTYKIEEQEGVIAYELLNRQRYLTREDLIRQNLMYGMGTPEPRIAIRKIWFYFYNGELVKWGRPNDWPVFYDAPGTILSEYPNIQITGPADKTPLPKTPVTQPAAQKPTMVPQDTAAIAQGTTPNNQMPTTNTQPQGPVPNNQTQPEPSQTTSQNIPQPPPVTQSPPPGIQESTPPAQGPVQQAQPVKTNPQVPSVFGTGFAVSEDGLIVTAFHNIEGAKVIKVHLTDGFFTTADVVQSDPINDLAVLKIKSSTPDFLNVSPMRSIKGGENAFTIGFVTTQNGPEQRFAEGMIGPPSGPTGPSSLLRINVPVLPQYSGGPLIDTTGQVVGVITSKAAIIPLFPGVEALPENIHIAIKTDYLRVLVDLPLVEQELLEPAEIVNRVRAATFLIETQ